MVEWICEILNVNKCPIPLMQIMETKVRVRQHNINRSAMAFGVRNALVKYLDSASGDQIGE